MLTLSRGHDLYLNTTGNSYDLTIQEKSQVCAFEKRRDIEVVGLYLEQDMAGGSSGSGEVVSQIGGRGWNNANGGRGEKEVNDRK
jgi:hypothetical protein